MKVPFFKPSIGLDLKYKLEEVLDSGMWTGGQVVEDVELQIKSKFSFPNFLCTSSGTSAFEVILDVLLEKSPSNIVVPVNTFVTTAEVPRRLGHNVIFCDVDELTGMISIDSLKNILQDHTVDVVIPVSIGGFLYEREKLIELKEKFGFKIIEDFAQLIYRSCYDNRIDASFFSFYPNKILSTPDGGGIVFSNSKYVEKAIKYRLHGIEKTNDSYDVGHLGRKANMTNVVATILNDQVNLLNSKIQNRKEVYQSYLDLLDDDFVKCRVLSHEMIPSLFIIHVNERNNLQKYLSEHGVQSSIHFKPLHMHTYWNNDRNYFGAERYYSTTLSLPFYDSLTRDEVRYISDLIKSFYSN